MQRASGAERLTIESAIETGDIGKMAEIITIVQKTGALAATREAAALEAQRAIDALGSMPPSRYRAALFDLASDLLLRRA